MKKIRGFTLIELLVVIGILTILAGIAIPNYLHAQVRAKVARAHADMRVLANALEAYKVDRNTYPCACENGVLSLPDRFGWPVPPDRRSPQYDSNGIVIRCYVNCNDAVIMATWPQRETPASWRCSFSVDPGFKSLTTPTAYITAYPTDPFADTQRLVYGYTNIDNYGWILSSFGPDCDESDVGEIGRLAHSGALTGVYHPEDSPSVTPLSVGGYTYDPTNGIESGGDVWRVKN